MAAWKITLPSGTEHTQLDITAGQFMAVAEVLDGATWENVEPTAGPRQLIAWVAILQAAEGEDGDVGSELIKVMELPMVQVIGMLNVDSEE